MSVYYPHKAVNLEYSCNIGRMGQRKDRESISTLLTKEHDRENVAGQYIKW